MTRPRSSGERLAEVQALAHLGSWDWDIPANHVEWSDEMFRIHGYAPQHFAVTFEKAIQLVRPEDARRIRANTEEILAAARAAFREGKPGPYAATPIEYRILRTDGEERILQGQGRVILNDAGEPVRMFGTVLDVTEHSRAVDALARSETRLRTIIESEPECVKLLAQDGRLLEMNPAGLRMIEADSAEQVLGQPVLPIVAPEHREAFAALNRQVFEGQSGMLEFEIIGLRGTRRWLETHAVPLRGLSGEVEALLGITRDVTERRRAERRYRDVFEHAPIGIFRATPDGELLLANPALARMLGYDSAEALSLLNLAEHVYWDPQERRRLVARYESETGPWEAELKWKRRDGRPIWVYTSTHAARDESGKVRYFQTYVQDITQQHRSLEVLRDITEGVLATGDEFFRSVVLRLSSALGMSHALVGELVPGEHERVTTIAAAAEGRIVENFTYVLAGTPGAHVVRQRTCSFPTGVRQRFPEDALLQEMGSESYVGSPLFSASGEALGLIAVLDRKPLEEEDLARQMVEVFATRAAAELERRRTEEAVRKGRARLRALSHRLLDVQEQERRYIARELHDQIGQALTAIKLNLQTIGTGDRDKTVRSALREAVLLVDMAIQQVRTLSFDLRPPMLDDLGLAAALGSYARRQATGAGLELKLQIDPGLDGITKDVETACFRIAQEAITNVVRHARAHRVSVGVRRANGVLELVVEDDGKGIAAAPEDDALVSAPGLLGMRERAEAAGGKLELSTRLSGGTKVRASFPSLPVPSAQPA